MQFSFSYYYFMIHTTHLQSTAEFLDNIDINRNNVYSDGELNILMTRLFTLPISETNRTLFWSILDNCTKIQKIDIYTPDNIITCPNMSSLIHSALKNVTTYKHDIVDDKDVTFKMLKSNSTKVRIDLDYVRSYPKKFICLNDNMDHGNSYEHLENKKMLAEFYQTMYPEPSPFEHPPGIFNKYLHKKDLFDYLTYQYISFHVPLCFLGIISALYLLYVKRKTFKRCLRNVLFRLMG